MSDFGETNSAGRNSVARNFVQGALPDSRQLQGAGDVDRRWWEAKDGTRSAIWSAPVLQGGPHRSPGANFNAPPPPPLNPEWFKTTAVSGKESIHVAGETAVASMPGPDGRSAVAGHGQASDSPTGIVEDPEQVQTSAQAGLDRFRVQRLELELAAARDEASALHEMLEDLPEIFERKFRQRLQSIQEQQQRLLADNQALREQLQALAPGAAGVETRPSRLLAPATQASLPPLQQRRPLGETLRRVWRLGRPDTV